MFARGKTTALIFFGALCWAGAGSAEVFVFAEDGSWETGPIFQGDAVELTYDEPGEWFFFVEAPLQGLFVDGLLVVKSTFFQLNWIIKSWGYESGQGV